MSTLKITDSYNSEVCCGYRVLPEYRAPCFQPCSTRTHAQDVTGGGGSRFGVQGSIGQARSIQL